jgi:hypothetical protein
VAFLIYVVTSVTCVGQHGGGDKVMEMRSADVRLWHLADMGNLPDVRFAPEPDLPSESGFEPNSACWMRGKSPMARLR